MIGENTHQRGLKQSVDWKLIGVYILLVLIVLAAAVALYRERRYHGSA